jgi:hypothetical protein
MDLKVCKTCKAEKGIEEFYKTPSGRHGSCKDCRNLKNKEYKKSNPDRMLKTYRAWYEKNKVKHSERRKAYYVANKEKMNRNSKEWYRKNKPKAAKLMRELRLKGYGITQSQYDSMLVTQNNKCASCYRKFSTNLPPVVDHDHNLGHVRGLLCRPCNLAEGFLKTIPAVRGLLRYMEKNELFYPVL